MTTLKKLLLSFFILIVNFSFAQLKSQKENFLNKGKAVEISHRRNLDNSIDFLYTKSQPGSYTVYYTFKNVKNTKFSDGVKKVVVKHNQGMLFKLRPSNPKKGISYKSSYRISKGITNPKFDEDFKYLIPFKEGTDVTLLNNAIDDSSSDEPTNKVSFKLQSSNAEVTASRKGVVTKIKNKTGKKVKITIEHEDGTFTNYAGFDSSKIKVKKGSFVIPGTLLGSLGETDDNLHTLSFQVTYKTKVNDDPATAYINPQFVTKEKIQHLEKNKTYTSHYDEEVFFEEFSKKEKKKYLKAKKA